MTSEDNAKKLRDRIKELEEKNVRLQKEKIEKEFKEFKAKHAITVINLRKALKIKPNSKKKHLPLGAPKGHKGYARHVPERIDYIKTHNPKKCPYCKTKLGETQEIRSRHVTDIKLIGKVKTTRHDIHRKYCPKCKKIVEL